MKRDDDSCEAPATVLVVDDDPTARLLTSQALKRSGFAVMEAANGHEAIELFDRVCPDIILLDVVMPLLDGFETCHALRQKPNGGGSVPIVMVTGADDLDSIDRAYEAGATDFITKPISWLILLQRVRYILRARQAMSELQKSRTLLAKAQRIALLGSWELDLGTERVQCSREAMEILGLEPGEPVGGYGDLLRHVPPEERHSLDAMINQAIHMGKPFKLDHTITPPNGNERFVAQQVEVISDQVSGQTLQLMGIVQDISARKQAELFESDRNRVLEMILANFSLNEILTEIAHLVRRQKPEMACALCLVRDDRLLLGAASDLPETFLKMISEQDIRANGCSIGAAAYHGQTMIVPDIGESPLWQSGRQTALECGIRTACSVPIFSGIGRVLGTLNLFGPTAFHPCQEDLRLLDATGKLAAVAVEQRQLSEKLAYQARHDSLTGLPNRAFLQEFSQQLVSRSAVGEKVAVMFIDLDRFKHVNDSLGHSVGDLLLKEVAERLRKCIRETDMLIRISGDEFLILLDWITDRQAAARVASRALDLFKQAFVVNDQEIHIGASIGLSIFPEDGADLETLQKNADVAMYHAKNQGGSQFRFYAAEMKRLLLERLEIENEMRKALERKELEIHYQPLFTMENGTLCGVEALLRWNHPSLGRIPPMKFIPIAEESGLIVPIGNWVLRESCRQNARWQHRKFPPFPVSVNVSAIELMRPDFSGSVELALRESGLAPQWLQLEITEGVLLENMETAAERLSEIRSLGVSVAIDDFGTGYSSMSYLQRLSVDCLKIDKTFVQELEGMADLSSRSHALIKAMVGLAQNLGLKIVAEGIESHLQQRLLSDMGCTIGQGFLFKEPVPAAEIENLFGAKKASTNSTPARG